MQYNLDRASIELSVRELCARALGGGDLEYGGGRSLAARGRIGADVHRRLQAERTGRYHPEVALSCSCKLGELTYTVSGRADGVEQDDEGFIVEEIKTMHSRAFSFAVPDVYRAQLRCYGYFLCVARELPGVRLRMVCVNLDDDRTREQTEYLSREQLQQHFYGLLGAIERWAELLYCHTAQELPHLAGCPFPYSDMRLGQERMVRAAHKAIKNGRRLFVQAPTGIGKTMSALYPAVRARGEGLCDRIFYLTAKASTAAEAFAACERLCESGAPLRAIVLTAREQCCNNPLAVGDGRALSSHCNSVECGAAAGYYDRVKDALYEMLSSARCYDRARIEQAARRHGVCPYELSLDLSEHCDVIIADYNYVFDPMVYLRRYFGGEASCGGKNVFLIDEAHNLSDRARDMYSATLLRRDFECLYAKVHRDDRLLGDALTTVIRAMHELRRLCRDNLETDAQGNDAGFYLSHSPISSFNERMAWFSDRCQEWLRAHGEEDIAPAVRDLAYTVKEFLCILERYDEHYVTYIELSGGETSVRLLCLDPSGELDRLHSRAVCSVLFSATLTPLDYFSDVLGGGKSADRLALPSPYERENFGLFAVDGVSTRYSQREESMRYVASCIGAAVSGKKGNYIAYFPSYSYLEAVLAQFRAMYPSVLAVVQKKGMRAAQRETFLEAFCQDTDVLRVGFCVLGGSFSEGVDLPGSRLIGAIVVGVGLPGLSGERNILKEYYQNKCETGHEYAYLYPGMNRVLQAAGRVIRTERDRGIVVLIDDRYATPAYRTLFPDHWSHVCYLTDAKGLSQAVGEFWQQDKSRK